MSKPLTRAVPEVGGTSVVNMRMSVDLPAPFGPSRPKISPCVDGEIQRVHGAEIAEALGQVFNFDGEHGVRASPSGSSDVGRHAHGQARGRCCRSAGGFQRS